MDIRNLYSTYIDITVSSVLGAVIAFSVCYTYFNPKIDQLLQHADATPPIIVVDMAQLALKSVPIGTDKKAIREHFKNTQEVIDKFKAAGFLVLSSSSVISSPEALKLNESDIPANQYLISEAKDE